MLAYNKILKAFKKVLKYFIEKRAKRCSFLEFFTKIWKNNKEMR
jgi:hypothetical protein